VDRECNSVLIPRSPPQLQPGKIDVGIIKLIHQDPEGHLVFWRNHDRKGDWHNKSIKVCDLECEIAKIENQLLEDCYMTVNSFTKSQNGHYRVKSMLHSLNACFSDLDCYKVGLGFEEARVAIQDRAKKHQIPNPSIIASSGRGMYLFWLLERLDISNFETVSLYQRVQSQIYETLKDLGADIQARDVCRVLRIPGSYHLKADRQVSYALNQDEQGQMPRHHLYELADFFSVAFQPKPNAKKIQSTRIDREIIEKVSDGPLPPGCLLQKKLPIADSPEKKVALAHIRELCNIAEKRGGIKRGCRHNFLWIYANRLYVLGVPISGLADYLLEMNAYGCDPPLESKDVFYASSGVKRYLSDPSGRIYQRNSSSIAELLKVTAEEVEQYNLKNIIPSEVKYRRRCECAERKMRRWMERTEKQRMMVKMIEGSEKEGVVAGRRELAKALGVAPQTITNWKRLMSIPMNPRGRPRHSGNSKT